MNFGKIALTFAAGLLIFVAILLAENARFEFKNNIKDPFQSTISVDRIDFSQSGKEKVTEVFSTDAEFFRFYAGSQINFSDGKREIVSGPLFISSQFVSDKDTKRAENSFLSEFTKTEFTPKISQFKVGNFYINMPQSSVFITRNKKRKRTKIYAVNHSVELFFRNADIPFTIPSNMFVDIRDELITEKTGLLYYTKLKKELRMQPFLIDLSLNSNELNDDINQIRIAESIKSKNTLHFKIKDFAQKTPQTWLWFETNGILGAFVGFIKKSQSILAIGYPDEKKQQLQFNELIKPFVLANTAVKNTDPELAQELLNKFEEDFQKKMWFKLLLNNEIDSRWTLFKNAHKAWLRNLFPDDPAQVFVTFWNKNNTTNSLADIESMFSSTELLISNNHYQEAFVRISEIKEEIKSIKVSSQNQINITKLRRLLLELVKERSFFQRNEIFELYGVLINKEMQVYTGERKEEIALESAQDILFFLNKFISRSDKSEIASTLVKVFNLLNVDAITKKRGRRIFTTQELELIKTIEFIGSSGLTKEIINSINDKKEYEELLKQQELARLNQTVGGPTKSTINGKSELLKYLQEFEIKTKSIRFTTTKNGYKFSNAQFLRFPVSGQFNIKTQRFDRLTIGSESERGLSRTTTKNFLSFIENNIKDITTGSGDISTIKKPPLKTQRAILERDLVQRYFAVTNIKIDMSNIIPIDFDYNRFQVTDAVYKNESRVSFVYLKKQDTVEQIILETGWVTREIDKVIPRKSLPETIDRLISTLSK